MPQKKKYYVVWQGFNTGIFDNWEECKKQVEGYTGAKYKSFVSFDLAYQAFHKSEIHDDLIKAIPQKGLCVDAAYSSSTHAMEYRGVVLPEKKEIFHQGPFYDATNNIGEFLALVHALALCKQKGWDDDIYSDSRTAIAWVRNKKTKTNLERTNRNEYLFELIVRAEKWLHENTFSNKIYKWETDLWGEIPADFGRK
ncbi:MAG TPA: ribonuclease H family protein [Bacteroidales bacterium]|jgi:ribonuclease HI|nr:ribonuclease H family protein [Bacteroidales bacterium]